MATIAQANSNQGQVKVASGLDLIAGLWLLLSAFFIPVTETMAWNFGLVGLIVTILAGVRAFHAYNRSWMSWVNAILGLWTILSPWALGAVDSDTTWNAVITGLVILVLGAWSALATDTARRYAEVHTTDNT